MNILKLPENIQAQIDEKVKSLTEKHNTTINPVVFVSDADANDYVIGYLLEPNRLQKMAAMDKLNYSESGANLDILTVCLIREASDERILSEAPENDKFFLGALKAAGALLKLSINLHVKK